jgi:trigger factor
MHVTSTLHEGLKRQFQVVVPAVDLSSRLTGELEKLRGRVNINGFRPGKVPFAHLKRVYGRSVMAEVIQTVVGDAQKKVAEDNQLRLASEPKVNFPEDAAVIEKVLACEADLDFSLDVEVLPKVEVQDHTGISLTREVPVVDAAVVDESIARMAQSATSFTPREAGAKAENGDKLTIDFAGSIDGVPFEGGTGGDVDLVLGSGQFIPGFEEQLIGKKAGDETVVKVSFPADYQAAHLAGKAAEFAVTVKVVAMPGEPVMDDAFAQRFGIESADKIRETVENSIREQLNSIARQKVKRQLLDALDKLYTFDIPASLLDQEFNSIWAQMQEDMQRSGSSFESEGKNEADVRAEYLAIASRRVRLGLLLSEIGEKAEVNVTDEEVTRALIDRARNFPGQEKQFFEFYRQNPQALAEIRAPIFEEKVIDHILTGVTIVDKQVTREELLAEDGEEGAPEKKDEAPAEKPKKAKAKKSTEA